jgi:hypothetical protein
MVGIVERDGWNGGERWGDKSEESQVGEPKNPPSSDEQCWNNVLTRPSL